MSAATKAAAAERGRAPLRRVVGHEDVAPERGEYGREILECGHRQHTRKDIAGPTNAYRRRCVRCLRGAPVIPGTMGATEDAT